RPRDPTRARASASRFASAWSRRWEGRSGSKTPSWAAPSSWSRCRPPRSASRPARLVERAGPPAPPPRRPRSVLQNARAVEREDDQAVRAERDEQQSEPPVEGEAGRAHRRRNEPGGAGGEAEHDDFLARHQDPEHVAPAEPGDREEHHAVRDLHRIDQVERPGEEAKQTE